MPLDNAAVAASFGSVERSGCPLHFCFSSEAGEGTGLVGVEEQRAEIVFSLMITNIYSHSPGYEKVTQVMDLRVVGPCMLHEWQGISCFVEIGCTVQC